MAEDANPGLRASGLGVVGDIPWGTHFCQFYQSKDDLLDILVPYLKAGLENNEFCMWVVSEPLGESEAKAALRQAVPQLDRYLSQGQLEIIPHTAWYLIDGVFESRRVLAGWAEKLQKGLAKGYDGLRLTGNTLWLESKDWSDFVAYEAEVDRVISDRRMIALCTYSLGACSATEIIDVVNNHQFALARRDGCWELVESAARRQATQSLRASEARLRQLNRTLTALRNSNKALARAADEAEYLKEVCRIVQQDCGHAMAWIGYAHDDAGKTVRSVACAGLDEGYLESARITWADTERGRGPTGTAIRTGKPQGCANTLTDPIFAPWRAEAAKRGYASSLVLPLLDRGRAFGALTIYSKEPGAFAQDQARALSDLADDVASGIMTLRLRAERERAEAVIAQSLRRFELLAQTAGELLRSPDPQKSVESLCRKVMEHLDCHVFFNFLSEPEKDPGSDCPGARLHLNACAGIPESEARKIEWLDYGAAICGRAARDACRIVAERISTTPDPRAELVKSYGIKAYASHPLLGIEGEVIGTLSFGTRSRETFSPDDLSLMQAVADQVATAMVRTKGERQLRQAKEDWERTFDAVPDLISILDKDSRIVQVNRAMAERLAISPEQCVGKPCHEAVHGLARPPASCPHILTCRDGKPHTAEIREERLDGDFLVSTTPLLDSQGRKTGAVHVARDITERKRAEAEMARLAAFPLHNPNPVAETDADGRIHLLNPAAETLLPDLRQKGRAHPWLQDWEAVIAELRSDPKRTILRDIAIGGRSYEQSLRLIVQTGHVHIYGQDITARKQAEAALQELNNELEQKVEERTKGIREAEAEKLKLRTQFLQAQKMEAVGLLASGIAHDFNNVLTTINGNNYFLLDGLKSGDPLRSCSLEIKRATEMAAALNHQLLAVGRVQAAQPRVLDANSAIIAMTKLLRRLVGENIETRLEPYSGLWPIVMDSGQLEQIVLNLAVNARDAMPRGGQLSVLTKNVMAREGRSPDPKIALPPGQYVMLEVRDTGIGMSPDLQRRIFEPFFTTKEPGRGTGLGLSTVMSIVEQSRGHISVESEPARGTRFRIYLPRAAEDAAAPCNQPASQTSRGGSETVLVVEDNDGLRAIIKKALHEKGYRVFAAGNGESALALSRKHHKAIHLLLSDLVLPDCDGAELAQDLLSARPELKIVFMSGYPGSVLSNASDLTKFDFIEKPFSPDMLLGTVRRALDAR